MLKNILLIFVFVLSSCQNHQGEQTRYLFDVDDELVYPDFLENGYKRVIVDVLLFEKIKNDTTIQLSFDYDLEDIKMKSWSFKIPTRNEEYIYDLLDNYDLVPIGGMSSYTHSSILKKDSIYKGLSFVVKHYTSRKIYICRVAENENGEVGQDYLSIRYYYPKKTSFFSPLR